MSDESLITTELRRKAAIFVDRYSQQWIVQDPEGLFWLVPAVEDPWRHRQPFEFTEETQLESIPAHYKHLLGLPF
jgi:hypothetical protein